MRIKLETVHGSGSTPQPPTDTKPLGRKRGRPALDLALYEPGEFLTTPERKVAYLEAAFDEDDGDGQLIALALGALARKYGMAEMAAAIGVNQASLYRTLSANGNPSLGTVLRILRVLGYRLMPLRQEAEAAE